LRQRPCPSNTGDRGAHKFKIPQSPGHPTYQVSSEGGAGNVIQSATRLNEIAFPEGETEIRGFASMNQGGGLDPERG
jgi:hypothetical protein